MFVADGLVFLELQKTGGSHICRLLEQYADGHAAGKHHRISKPEPGQFIMGSIRNPWDWYVSLWAFGCGNKGSIRMRTGRHFDMAYYRQGLPIAMGKERCTASELLTTIYTDLSKPVSRWQNTYRDSSDANGFREWLTLLLDTKHRFDIGEGYGFSPLSSHAGLLSYRYFRLFTLGDGIYTDKRLSTVSGLAEFDKQENLVNGVVRTESLEDDFIRFLGEAGIPLSEQQVDEIKNRQKKTNTSKRLGAAHYYDEDTLALVAEKEAFLIQKYDYAAPAMDGK